ncbi:MAG: hypothetical protein CMB99_05165 [Flavobacteriaceae bacterium]|nr:hypothetical protein [Flavobacteriaceae bacterium]
MIRTKKLQQVLSLILVTLIFSCAKNADEAFDFTTKFEQSEGFETATYAEVIDYYKALADTYDEFSLFTFGQTDSGEPLHLLVYDSDRIYNISDLKNATKRKVLINNGIHPGESDGIDASMMLLRDIVKNDSLKSKYKDVVLAVIPVYNVGGAFNRNSHTRTNQNGPKAYGFRGNARNFDLNRDFIKQDSKNAAAFAEIFHALNPDVFIDTHVSNGADYQYTLTHLFTQHNKLGGKLGPFLETEMRPYIESSLQQKGLDITPYVNVWGSTPEKGWSQFYDGPRYSTGYTTLFHSLGFMIETHMLKPYKDRVEQTYELLFSTLDFTVENADTISELRQNAVSELLSKKSYAIAYEVDRTNPSTLQFKGYEGSYIDSKVTNGKRLFYDRSKPYTKEVKYYNNFVPSKEIRIPNYYILKKGWHAVFDRLKTNEIQYSRFEKDTLIEVEVNHIDQFDTRRSPYEGHYLHYNTKVRRSVQKVAFSKGDILIPTNQNGVRYLLETLEAEAPDSFFNWNFFDTILQRKEGYSAYVFEDIAEELLKNDALLKKQFEEQMKDENFAKSPRAQLNFIHKNSPHYEKAHMQLPIYKIF